MERQDLSPAAMTKIIADCKNDECKVMALFIILSLQGSRKYLPMHSVSIGRSIHTKNTKEFNRLMRGLSPWMGFLVSSGVTI